MLLFRLATGKARGFEVHVVDRELAIGPGGEVARIGPGPPPWQASGQAWLVPWGGREALGRGIVLLARTGAVRVNARPALPVTVLKRGDEIRVNGVSLFFSDETPLQVVPFSRGREDGPVADTADCARCHGPIQAGDPVVFCPACGTVYMAQPDRSPNCWDFGPCLSCGRNPKVEFSWQPRASAPAQPWHQRPWRKASRTERPVASGTELDFGGSQ